MTPVRPTAAIVASVLWGPGMFVAAFFAMFSVMLFDAPGSENNPYLKLAAAGIWSSPVLCLVSIVASWLAWVVTRNRAAEAQPMLRLLRVGVACLPLISAVITVIGFVLLQVKCGGSTRCE